MKVLVTGGAGFIGSHVVDRLLEGGHDVVVFDNLSTGKKENVNEKAVFVEHDITDTAATTQLLGEHAPDMIVHAAAQISVHESVENPVVDATTNIVASVNLFQWAATNGAKRVVFLSTGGAIYGDTEQRPTIETHHEQPVSPYGVAKLACDKYLEYFHHQFQLPYVSLRLGNVYGPRQNPHGEAGVVAIFLQKLLAGEQPVINGDGNQTRDYVYVSDVVDSVVAALTVEGAHGVYNVGTGIETSVNELFAIVNAQCGGKATEEHGPAKEGEQQTSSLNSKKIARELDTKPTTMFQDGVVLTHEWFSKQ